MRNLTNYVEESLQDYATSTSLPKLSPQVWTCFNSAAASSAADTDFGFRSQQGSAKPIVLKQLCMYLGVKRTKALPSVKVDAVLLVITFLFEEFFEVLRVFFIMAGFDNFLDKQDHTVVTCTFRLSPD